ncbi:MAG TPA: hypothetical protein VHV10_12450 [Ktedonobacteraceae bacterium]|nr:hypothetical protein [Ktedonobacteraceae bacterium]
MRNDLQKQISEIDPGMEENMFLEHQGYTYRSDRTVFRQGDEPICGIVCVAMLVADQIPERRHENTIEIVKNAINEIGIRRVKRLKTGSKAENELIVLNNLLGVSDPNIGQGYVLLANIKDDELSYFIQASMDHEERGCIAVTQSHMGSLHGVVIDNEITVKGEECLGLRCPTIGPYSLRKDLFSRSFSGSALVPAATWQEFLTKRRNDTKRTRIWPVAPNPSGPDAEWYYVRDGEEIAWELPN